VNILGEKRQFFELMTKKGSQNFCLKIGHFFGKSDIFRLESKISATGFTTPQTSNQIDAAVILYKHHTSECGLPTAL